MYSYISGQVTETGYNYVVLDTNGIGYLIFTNSFSIKSVTEGKNAKLFVHLVVKEDELSLYGFLSFEEKLMFEKLIAITGIGPKVALSLLSAIKVSDIAAAVLSNNAAAFETVSGIGKKTAQRLVLELKEKVDIKDAVTGNTVYGTNPDAAEEAISALVNLGYQQQEAFAAVSAVAKLGDTAEDFVLLALKRLSR